MLKNKAIHRFIFITFILVSNSIYCTSNAASQGKLGNRSTASINISVHINQTLTTIYPEQLLLSSSTSSVTNTSQAICVINQGFGENASVPYELIIENLILQNIGENPAYYVYIKENGSNKESLSQGVSITNQSILTFADMLDNKCNDMDMSIAIESSNPSADPNSISDTPGLLLLLVSPN